MSVLTERCVRLREAAVNAKPLNRSILAQHTVLFEAGMYDCLTTCGKGAHAPIAAGVVRVMLESPAFIQPDELLVGYNYADTPYPEFWSPSGSEADRQLVLEAGFTEAQYEAYMAHHAEVLSRYQFDRHAFRFNETNDPDVAERFPFLKALSPEDLALDDEWAAIGRCMSDNHTIVGYERVLKLGFSGLRREVESAEAVNGRCDMYDAMKSICDAAGALGEKYARLAEALALNAAPGRREELLEIARTCRRVPAEPARTFREALQSLVFAHIINTWEDGINANSLGRLDQMLFPYYQRDIEAGRLTGAQAFELICCLWLKLYRDYDVQQSSVGGVRRDGSDGVNALSWMMLDATEALGFVRCLSVRYSPRTDPAFLLRAVQVVGRVGKGIPFFFNDDVLIPALCEKGIALEDARDYTQIGCVETVIPGHSNPHAVSGEVNLLKAVEYALADGRSLFDPSRRPGLRTGALETFTSYVAFRDAVCRQIENLIDVTCRKVALWADAAARHNPKPVKSLLTEDCVASGRDFNARGARYDYYQIMLAGVPNLADSLVAIRKLVYEEGRFSLEALLDQLENDFPDEAFRQICLNKAPKYGNDIPEVDAVAAGLIEFGCDVLRRMDQKYGLSFHPQPFTYLWMVEHGRVTAATPDGRHRGDNIAYSLSPMLGRDFNGLTALMNSLCALPSRRCPGTISAIVEVDPKLFSEANAPRFADLLLAAAERGLSNVQFNITDAETLRDAQLHPEDHAGLAVRVSGFSQKFNLLDRALQDHIIARTKHICL